MKKFLLTTAILLGVNTYSQITDLESLLGICSASASDLTTLNAYGWEVLEPTTKYSENRESITESYKFSHSDNKKNEMIERQVIFYTNYNFKRVRTNFYSNDWDLLKKIKREIITNRYNLKSSKPHLLFYSGEHSNIGIVDAPKKDEPNLKAGYFMISVFPNNQN